MFQNLHILNFRRIYIYEEVERSETVQSMLDKYEIASNDKEGKLKLLQALLADYSKKKEEVFEEISQACVIATRLEGIGLGRSALNSVAYIERLIDSEEKGSKPNKADRLKQLRHFR